MSNQSSCRVLRTLGMDGFLGFKCGPSCSEKQHNKEIKALIDAIDDLLAYDLETKKELGAEEPGVNAMRRDGAVQLLGDINRRCVSLRGSHTPDLKSSDQRPGFECDTTLGTLGATAASARRRMLDADGWKKRWLSDEEKFALTSNRGELWDTHRLAPEVLWSGTDLE